MTLLSLPRVQSVTQDMVDKDMTNYNKQYILRIVTESVTMVTK